MSRIGWCWRRCDDALLEQHHLERSATTQMEQCLRWRYCSTAAGRSSHTGYCVLRRDDVPAVLCLLINPDWCHRGERPKTGWKHFGEAQGPEAETGGRGRGTIIITSGAIVHSVIRNASAVGCAAHCLEIRRQGPEHSSLLGHI